MKALSSLGLGLSTNLGDRDVPDALALFKAQPGLFDFVEYSAPLSVQESQKSARFTALCESGAPVVYHPVHLNLWGPELESEQALADLQAHLRKTGSPWVGNDVAWWHVRGREFPGYQYLAPPFDAEGLAQAAAHARHVQAALDRPLLLENPAVVALRGEWHVLDFMGRLSDATGCGLILDLGHLLAFQRSCGLPLAAVPFDKLDVLGRVVEIHIAGGVLAESYFDDHAQAVREELFTLLEEILPRCTALRAVTFEGDGHPEEMALVTLRRLRPLFPPPSGRDEIGDPPPFPPPASPGEESLRGATSLPALQEGEGVAEDVPNLTSAWSLFDKAFGRAEDDAPFHGLERLQRLAVIAEQLDRDLPLTRALLAPEREGLLAFTRSDAFREAFDPERPPLAPAFGRYARRHALDAGDEVLGAVVSYELVKREGGCFPFDFRELEHAYRALRRHLSHRALGVGSVEHRSFSGLRQVAARAPRAGPR